MPVSTYRLQVNAEFDLYAAAGVADYLAALGVTDAYTSPLLASAPGSTHGYDVTDPRVTDAGRGGEEGRQALLAALRATGLGLVIDLVPNHMGVGSAADNPFWWDVLRLGPRSPYASWFDVDWSAGKLLLPVLGDSATELDALRVVDGELAYHDKRYPLAPGTSDLGDPRAVHDAQHYELVSWRRADTEQNYRRFFAITELAGLRVEDEAVFDATHAEILRWVAAGEVQGLRIDHPDGLTDPTGYFERLAARSGGVWTVVEKILEPGEELPPWPVAGTSGYDAMAEADGILVDPAGEAGFTELDTRLAGGATNWPDLVHLCKHEIVAGILRAEVLRLAGLAPEIDAAEAALAELLAAFPVYRSYLPYGTEHLAAAVDVALAHHPELTASIDALRSRLADEADPLAVRFQQTSGAVMAKGVEDTAYYRWTRFVALNEVGGDPDRFGLPPAEFHEALARRQDHHPAGMTALSTHDTKRSADVRARLAVLAELPDEWAAAVDRWSALATPPDGVFGHLLWQTVVGAWPIPGTRLHAYLEKAMREAGTHTTWADPDEAYEAAVHAVADAVLAAGPLHDDVAAFCARVTPYGWSNSLSQALVQLTMPGVPDTYQGTELWDLSLVDPDNRRPVDYDERRALLARLDGDWRPPVDETGAAKLHVVSRALRLRRDRPELFSSYTPLFANGVAGEHCVAYDRGGAITVATRLPVRLERDGGWRDAWLTLPDGSWTDVLTGRRVASRAALGPLLADYPVALLVRSS